jgi:hypothetical protein
VANVVVSAIATWNGKALNKGKKDISAFDKQVGKLGRTFAGVFGASALLNYSKRAVQAFALDEKAAKALELQLKNTGNAFAAPSIEYYIDNLQKTTGVLDDQLRPAFQQLLTVTGSITKSQGALNTALNVSAATGKSLTEVTAALTRGYSGNTTGLSRLGAGISKATLKAGDMDKIIGELNNKFAGQAQARLTTYAGKMDLLTVATENFKEEIGKGILDALSALGKDKSIENATSQMDKFGKSIGDAIYGTGLLIAKLNGLVSKAGGGGLADLLIRLQPGGSQAARAFDFVRSMGASDRNKPSSNFTYGLGSSATADIERAKEVLRLRAANKLRQDEINKLKAKAELDKLTQKFDVERIGLLKALGEATDAETKLRLQSKLAILDNNEALAAKYLAEMEAAKNATKLSTELSSTADALAKLRIVTQADYTKQMYAGSAIYYQGNAAPIPSSAAAAAPTVINNNTNLTVEGTVISQDAVLTTVQEALQRLQKQGSSLTVAGSLS